MGKAPVDTAFWEKRRRLPKKQTAIIQGHTVLVFKTPQAGAIPVTGFWDRFQKFPTWRR